MGSKIIEIFNKIAYNVLSALYQPFWAAVLLAFLTMFLYLYGKEHGWKKNNFIRNMFATWWRAFKSSSNFRRTFLLAFYTAMILLRTVLNREIWFDSLGKIFGGWGLYEDGQFTTESIGIIFMENSNDNFELASKLQLLIREKYNWKVNIGYETKEKVEGTLFISNRNNVKGLEFPFVICIMQDALTYDYSIRNSIYMMLTRSFLTSYLILPDTAKNINLLEEGIGFVNRKGFLKVEEPSDDEKRNLANAIINRGNLHKSLFQKAEEIMDEMGVVDKEHRDMIHQLIRVRFKNKENDENKLRKFIQANSGALE